MNSHIAPLHEMFTPRIERIGLEQEPVIVIDNFLRDPESLIDYAAANKSRFTRDAQYYPGLRIPCPIGYMQTVYGHLSKTLSEVFQLPQSGVQAQSFFSIVTLSGERLDLMQRIPHYDLPDKTSIAMIHFLCSNKFGGTAFYRHKATGFEFIDKTRVEHYSDVLKKEIQNHGVPEPAYINGDTALYQRIGAYSAEFNRILIYRSSSLHSGSISPDYARDPNPRTGRLTITSFMKGRD